MARPGIGPWQAGGWIHARGNRVRGRGPGFRFAGEGGSGTLSQSPDGSGFHRHELEILAFDRRRAGGPYWLWPWPWGSREPAAPTSGRRRGIPGPSSPTARESCSRGIPSPTAIVAMESGSSTTFCCTVTSSSSPPGTAPGRRSGALFSWNWGHQREPRFRPGPTPGEGHPRAVARPPEHSDRRQ